MRLAALIFTGCTLLGSLLCLAAVAAGVLAGAIPFPDGPNAGHISGPGLGRWIETYDSAALLIGVMLTLVGVPSLVVLAAIRVHRQRSLR